MPYIKFSVSDELYHRFNQEANELGVSLQDYVRFKLIGEESGFTPYEAVKRALNKFTKDDDPFFVADIYGDDWTLTRGPSGVFGKKFYNYIHDYPEYNIRFVEMVRGRATYRIVE